MVRKRARPVTSLLIVIALASASVACGILSSSPLRRATIEAERLPFVVRTVWHGSSWEGPETIEIYISDETTPEQGKDLWCEVLLPHGADDWNTSVENAAGTLAFLRPTCPE